MGQKQFGIDGFTLKWIALITMAIDHTGMVLFPQYRIMRFIGRLAFPIYCFLLVEGAVHTSNPKKYLERLLSFAILSEIPFNLVCSGKIWYSGGQNVFFTLSLGLIVILCLQRWGMRPKSIAVALALIVAAECLGVDYGGGGVLIILAFYLCRMRPLKMSVAFAGITAFCYGGVQNYAIASLIPILCYNGKRGRSMKYFFYVFYPLHLLLLYYLRGKFFR